MRGKEPDAVVKVRFRVLDGRKTQLSVKTDIKATVRELSKYELSGTLKRGVSIYNSELKECLEDEIKIINDAFDNLKDGGYDLTSESLAEEIENIKHPKKVERIASPTFLPRFREFIDEKDEASIATIRDYNVVYAILKRYLIINNCENLKCMDFDKKQFEKFRTFCRDEYKYVSKYPYLYVNLSENNVPTARRSANTIVSKLKKIRAFLIDLESNDEINKNPIRKLKDEERRKFLKEDYENGIVALTFDELTKLKEMEIPDTLKVARDAFLLQCYIGARISDFKEFSMNDLKTSDGIAYLAYTPRKTAQHKKEVITPLIKSAYDIVLKYNFDFSILNYASGQNGYNAKIKKLFQLADFSREVRVWNEDKKKFDYVAIRNLASSKVGRKTCVTLCVQHSNDENAAGLHSAKSEATKHYHDVTLMERYGVFCRAFGEINEPYINK